MGELIRKLRCIPGRSGAELRVRGMQTLASAAERTRLSRPTRLPASGPELLDQFRSRSIPRLSPAFTDRPSTVAALRHRFGEATGTPLLNRADGIVQERFDLLGLRQVSFGSPIDWHLDPVSGTRTSLAHWSRFARPDLRLGVDHKLRCELNRHQSFVVLGRAYWLTDNERYAEAFAGQLASWLKANPPGRGINWSSSLEIAFRAISWTWALHLFRDAPQLTPTLFHEALEQLHAHARHIATHLSTYYSPNTHLTGEALALVYVGTLWPELRPAARWRATGLKILLSALERQVHPDGMYFERATAYHRYTVQFYSHLVALAQTNGIQLDVAVADRLRAMLDHLLHISRPDGTLPLVGDDDGGQLLPLDERHYTDLRSTLATGAALLGITDYPSIACEPSEEVLWLLGPHGLHGYDQLASSQPAEMSRGFDQGGLYVMRDSWAESGNVLTISCGTSGGAHAHADALAFDLSAGGRSILPDAGTYSYTREDANPNDFRTTMSHNTITVDGLSASIPSGPFGWSHVAHCSVHAWCTHPRFDLFSGEHDGYHRLPDPVSHVRSILFIKKGYWVIRDRLVAAGTHRYMVRFHFDPSALPVILDDQSPPVIHEDPGDAPGLAIATFGAPGSWTLSSGYISPCYGARTAAAVASFTTTGSGPLDLLTFVLPHAAREAVATVRQVNAIGGRAFEIRKDGHTDELLTTDGGIVEGGAIESDFELSWVRADEMIMVNGTRVTVSGEAIVRTGSPTAWAHARLRGGRWGVEFPCAG